MPRIAFKTFGCKVNLCDSRDLAARLQALGAEVVPGRDPRADAYLVNTCAVTDRAVRKGAQFLRSVRRDRPGAPIAVFGCGPSYGKGIPELEGAARFARGEEEALVAFLAERLGLLEGVPSPKSQVASPKSQVASPKSQVASPGSEGRSPGRGEGETPVEPWIEGAREDTRPPIETLGPWTLDLGPSTGRGESDPELGRTRAFVKVGDGCAGGCTYCVVPRLRGRPQSRAPQAVCAEAARFAASGRREIVLTAIHLGTYGRDLDPRVPLSELVRRVGALPGVARVRLSSVEATEVDEGLLSLADFPPFAPHFHLPLQSGDDEVLRRMGRKYTAAEFLDRVARVRSRFPAVGLTTDVIVGFPGEADEAFGNTLRVVGEAGFTRLHAFPWSPREGAPAASFPGRVARDVQKRRVAALIALGAELARAFRASRAGALDAVLAEREAWGRPGFVEGWDGVYQRVVFPGGPEDLGRLLRVRITGVEGDACVAERA
jgi:threonylcarbamoyladenosine tRNA methylthiotransferase MtaB